MSVITISERAGLPEGHNAVIRFDRAEYPITIKDPFSNAEEELLEWYFEEHLRFPFVRDVDARRAAESVTEYGHQLFQQVFSDREVFSRYREGVQTIEVDGSPDFHRLHWESLKDPALPQPLSRGCLWSART
jgi:hypothetical protein